VDFDIKPELALLQRKLKPSKKTTELLKESIQIAIFYGIVALQALLCDQYQQVEFGEFFYQLIMIIN